jgi:hypothetical protein
MQPTINPTDLCVVYWTDASAEVCIVLSASADDGYATVLRPSSKTQYRVPLDVVRFGGPSLDDLLPSPNQM